MIGGTAFKLELVPSDAALDAAVVKATGDADRHEGQLYRTLVEVTRELMSRVYGIGEELTQKLNAACQKRILRVLIDEKAGGEIYGLSRFRDGVWELVYRGSSLRTDEPGWSDIGKDIETSLAAAAAARPAAPAAAARPTPTTPARATPTTPARPTPTTPARPMPTTPTAGGGARPMPTPVPRAAAVAKSADPDTPLYEKKKDNQVRFLFAPILSLAFIGAETTHFYSRKSTWRWRRLVSCSAAARGSSSCIRVPKRSTRRLPSRPIGRPICCSKRSVKLCPRWRATSPSCLPARSSTSRRCVRRRSFAS